jgi:hypothetical protein
MKEHRTTEEEMEGPTSPWGLRNRITRLTLREHDDDDDDDDDDEIPWIGKRGIRNDAKGDVRGITRLFFVSVVNRMVFMLGT